MRSKKISVSKRRRLHPALVGVISVAVIVGGSLILATVWQSVEDASQTDMGNISGVEVFPVDLSGSELTSPSQETPLVGDPNIGQLTDYTPVEAREEYPYSVPDTGYMVDTEYFDDALFLGDSISVGIPLYGVMPNAEVIAVQGIHTRNVNTTEIVETEDGSRVTMLEAAKLHGEKSKIYIMLGGNGLGYEREPFLEGYKEFIRSVKREFPKATIYIQSILPVTEDAYINYPIVSNEKIADYNVGIMEMARELDVYYLDVAAAMVDEDGKLPTEGSPSDGIHLTGPYYYKWFDYLRSHTVQ